MSKFKSFIIYIKEKCKQKEFLYAAIFFEFLISISITLIYLLFLIYTSDLSMVYISLSMICIFVMIITLVLILRNYMENRKKDKIRIKFSIRNVSKFFLAIIIYIFLCYSFLLAFLPFSRVGIYDFLYPYVKNENTKKLFATDILAKIAVTNNSFFGYKALYDYSEEDISKIIKYFPELSSEEEFSATFNKYHNENFYEENLLFYSLSSYYGECSAIYLHSFLDLGKDHYVNEFNNLANINSIRKGYLYVLIMVDGLNLTEDENEIIMEHMEDIYLESKEINLEATNLIIRKRLYELRGDENNMNIINERLEELRNNVDSEG